MDNLNLHIAEKIKALRKANNLTQNQLAEKINYSNKAISRWETGEVIPDVETLNSLCDVFGITLASLFEEETKEIVFEPKHKYNVSTKLAISLLAVLGVWVVATVLYALLMLGHHNVWQLFIYAIPLSCVVGIIFSCIWGKPILTFMLITSLLWSLLTSVFLLFFDYGVNIWYVYIIGIPLQIGILLWGAIYKNVSENKKKKKKEKNKDIKQEQNIVVEDDSTIEL